MFFLELFKRCSKNICYVHPHRVGVKLPTFATGYTRNASREKKEAPLFPPCVVPLSSPEPLPRNPSPPWRPRRQPPIWSGMDRTGDGLPPHLGMDV